MITEYGLAGTEQTLAVVNIHGLNFTFGLAHFRAQIDDVRRVVESHRWPLIVGGDLNTWRPGRSKIVARFAENIPI